jgi:hypothetical protein
MTTDEEQLIKLLAYFPSRTIQAMLVENHESELYSVRVGEYDVQNATLLKTISTLIVGLISCGVLAHSPGSLTRELKVLLHWFMLEGSSDDVFSRNIDHADERLLVWLIVGRVCREILFSYNLVPSETKIIELKDIIDCYR